MSSHQVLSFTDKLGHASLKPIAIILVNNQSRCLSWMVHTHYS